MLVKSDKLKQFLSSKNLTSTKFAQLLDIEESEVDKLLNGEEVGILTARKFIGFFKADVAQLFIDWEKMNIKNPLKEI